MATRLLEIAPRLSVAIPEAATVTAGTSLYMAGPLGFAETSRLFHQGLCTLIKELGATVLDPWSLPPLDELTAIEQLPWGEEHRERWRTMNQTIGTMNTDSIRRSNGLVAVLDGQDVDSGTSAEIGFAYALGLPVLGLRSDFRLSADNVGGIVNLQVEYFIRSSGIAPRQGTIVRSISDIPAEVLRIWG